MDAEIPLQAFTNKALSRIDARRSITKNEGVFSESLGVFPVPELA